MPRFLQDNAHRSYYAMLLLSLGLVAFAGWVSVQSAIATGRAIDQSRHSQEVIEQVNHVMAVYGSTESYGLRWAVTFDRGLWQRFQQAMHALDEESAALVSLVGEDAAQRRHALALAEAVEERHAHGRRVWPRLEAGGVQASLDLLRGGVGADLGQRISAPAAAMIAHENEHRAQRDAHLREQLQQAISTVVAATGLALIAGLIGLLATAQSRRAWAREREAGLQREKAEAASQQKSLFLATMSHEIRTPMNAIFGFSQLLSRRVKDPKSLDYVRAIRSSGQSLLALINDLLDLSKVEAGRLELQPVPTDVRDLVESTLSVFADPAAAKGLRLTADIDPFLPRALVLDPHRVRQVLMNLVSNAVKYTAAGFVRVDVRLVPAGERRVDLELAVADSGAGIPADQREKIFEPFHRLGLEQGERVEGTGLGLSIVRSLVELMGGRVLVQAGEEAGSVFLVRLPGIEVAATETPVASGAAAEADFRKLAPSRILIVDDVPLNRELLSAYLADAGHELAFADDGLQAIEQVRTWHPTVVLLDIRMPRLDGRQAAERIRELAEGRRICLVAVTASSMTSDERQLRQMFDAYLRKPVSPRDLYDCLLELVGTRSHPEGCSVEGQARAASADEDAPMSAAQRATAEPAVQALEALVASRLAAVQATMRMKELRQLGGEIIDLGERGGLDRVVELGTRLQSAVDSFDMTTLDSLLDQLPRFVAAQRHRLEER